MEKGLPLVVRHFHCRLLKVTGKGMHTSSQCKEGREYGDRRERLRTNLQLKNPNAIHCVH